MLPREANFRSVVKIARATDEPCPGDPIETYGDARRDALLWADDEIDRLRAERAEARSFIRSTYDQFEKHHPYAHELRTRYPWLEDAVANVKLLQLAEQHPAPQEWYDEAKGETDAAR